MVPCCFRALLSRGEQPGRGAGLVELTGGRLGRPFKGFPCRTRSFRFVQPPNSYRY